MIREYIKKPVIIKAIQYTGSNVKEIEDFLGQIPLRYPDTKEYERCLGIPTLEGIMRASIGDYIIKGVQGECYPCKPDIFKLTYDEL